MSANERATLATIMDDSLAATTEPRTDEDAAKLDKLKSLVETIRFCMMTTVGSDGALHSRPMSFLEWTFRGELLFFTSATSGAVQELKWQNVVNLAFCEPSKNIYVSVLGEARIVNDQAMKDKLFFPIMKNWFPGGSTDPILRLLSISPLRAEYWDGLSGLALLISLAKSRLTDTPQPLGEHQYFQI